MKHLLAVVFVVCSVLAPQAPAVVAAQLPAASSYEARRTGDIVRLEDRKHAVVVSILTSVGNIAYEMTVKGHNVLRFPFATIDEFKARPAGLHGIPLMAPWANRLDEQAFYANGKRYPFDMELGNVSGDIPRHGFMSLTDRWQVVEARQDGRAAWVTSRLEAFRQPSWMKQWPFAHTIEMTYRLADGELEVRTTIANHSAEPMPVSIGYHPYFQLTDSARDEWTVTIPARTRWLLSAQTLPTGETEPTDAFFARLRGCAEGLQPRRRVHRSGEGPAGTGHRHGERPRSAHRRLARCQLQIARRLLAEPGEPRVRQPDPGSRAEPGGGTAACPAGRPGQPSRGAGLRLLRTDGGHHERAEPRPQGRLSRTAVRRARRNMAGELLGQAQRVLMQRVGLPPRPRCRLRSSGDGGRLTSVLGAEAGLSS